MREFFHSFHFGKSRIADSEPINYRVLVFVYSNMRPIDTYIPQYTVSPYFGGVNRWAS